MESARDRLSPRRVWILLAGILVVAAGLRMYGIGAQPLWIDEADVYSRAAVPTVSAAIGEVLPSEGAALVVQLERVEALQNGRVVLVGRVFGNQTWDLSSRLPRCRCRVPLPHPAS